MSSIIVILPDHNTVEILPSDDPAYVALRWEHQMDSLTIHHYIKYLRAEGWFGLASGTIE